MTHKSSDKLLESLSALADGEISELELHRLLRAFADDTSLQKTWQNYHFIRDVLLSETLYTNTFADASILEGIREAIDSDSTDEPSLRGVVNKSHKSIAKEKPAQDFADSASHANSGRGAEFISNRYAASQMLDSLGAQERGGEATPRQLGGWHAWLGKSAVAASVAVAFVVGLGQVSNWSVHDEPSAVLAASVEQPGIASMGAPLGFELPAIESRNVSTDMNRNFSPALMVRHNPLIEPDVAQEQRAQRILNQLHIMHAERATANGGFGILPFARVSEMDMSAETRVQR